MSIVFLIAIFISNYSTLLFQNRPPSEREIHLNITTMYEYFLYNSCRSFAYGGSYFTFDEHIRATKLHPINGYTDNYSTIWLKSRLDSSHSRLERFMISIITNGSLSLILRAKWIGVIICVYLGVGYIGMPCTVPVIISTASGSEKTDPWSTGQWWVCQRTMGRYSNVPNTQSRKSRAETTWGHQITSKSGYKE